jgi:hypothetical protein
MLHLISISNLSVSSIEAAWSTTLNASTQALHSGPMESVSIGCEQGGPEGGFFGSEKVVLYRLLARHVSSTHCSAIDQYALVLRVDGSLATFGDEGLARLRFARARRYITVDIQIPEHVWRPLTVCQTRSYLAEAVKAALEACTRRLRRDKLAVDDATLMREVDAAIADYLCASAAQ